MGYGFFTSIYNSNVSYASEQYRYVAIMPLFPYISGAGTFIPEDAFVGYQSDTPASIVFRVWQDLKLNKLELSDDDKWEEEV